MRLMCTESAVLESLRVPLGALNLVRYAQLCQTRSHWK